MYYEYVKKIFLFFCETREQCTGVFSPLGVTRERQSNGRKIFSPIPTRNARLLLAYEDDFV